MSVEDRAQEAVELSRRIKKLAETPAEIGAEHSHAQGALASMGVELADIIIDAEQEG